MLQKTWSKLNYLTYTAVAQSEGQLEVIISSNIKKKGSHFYSHLILTTYFGTKLALTLASKIPLNSSSERLWKYYPNQNG
jgi:hypothetical protein